MKGADPDSVATKPEAEDLPGALGEGPTRLLSFYDRLRRRLLAFGEARGGQLGGRSVRAVLAVPDIFLLLVRLSLDREVPKPTRALIAGALAYFVLPFDFLPEGFVGPVGFLDDLILAVSVLENAFSRELAPLARRHWSGSEDLHQVLQDLSASGRWFLSDDLYDRLRRLLARRGISFRGERE